MIPLFNRTLMDLKAPGYIHQRWQTVDLGREPLIAREPGPFRPPQQRAYSCYLDGESDFVDWVHVDLKKEFWNIGVQMVLRLRNICLDPTLRVYEGGDWQVQGQSVRHFFSHVLHMTFGNRCNPE